MIAVRLAPVFVMLGILGAHFYRAGELAFVVVVVALLALLFVRRPWAAWGLAAGLVLGALEWLSTLAGFVAQRQAMGAPYTRLAIILGVVALLTAASALVLRSRAVRGYFRFPETS